VYQAEKTVRDLGDKVPVDLKGQIDEKVKAVKDKIEKDDADAIRKAADDLGQALQKVGAAAYAQQPGGPGAAGPGGPGGGPGSEGGPGGAGPQQPGGGSSGPGGDNVVDGEFHNAG